MIDDRPLAEDYRDDDLCDEVEKQAAYERGLKQAKTTKCRACGSITLHETTTGIFNEDGTLCGTICYCGRCGNMFMRLEEPIQ